MNQRYAYFALFLICFLNEDKLKTERGAVFSVSFGAAAPEVAAVLSVWCLKIKKAGQKVEITVGGVLYLTGEVPPAE